jgi:hypothetical protein
VWDQLIHELYEGAVLIFHRNYELNTIPAYRRFQLLLIVTEKIKGPKMMKMTVCVGRWYFVVKKKTMMPNESSWDFFIKGLMVMRASIAKSFSLAGDTFV